jgi:hypothetical protein
MDYFKTTSPCGIDCFNCELFGDNITPELQERIAQYRSEPQASIRCLGCRETGCLVITGECATKTCVAEKGVDFCYECGDFPCNRLHPCAERAETFPQSFKVFNLCRIKKVGLDRWAEEEAAAVRERYYRGKLHIGNGPHLE